jgi:hypothetical protein
VFTHLSSPNADDSPDDAATPLNELCEGSDARLDRGGSSLAAMPRDASAGPVVRSDLTFNGVKVFSATMFAARDQLGETVTTWLAAHTHLVVTDIVVTQSSDSQFHCLAITVFYWERLSR